MAGYLSRWSNSIKGCDRPSVRRSPGPSIGWSVRNGLVFRSTRSDMCHVRVWPCFYRCCYDREVEERNMLFSGEKSPESKIIPPRLDWFSVSLSLSPSLVPQSSGLGRESLSNPRQRRWLHANGCTQMTRRYRCFPRWWIENKVVPYPKLNKFLWACNESPRYCWLPL